MKRIKLVFCGGKIDYRGPCLPEGMNEKFDMDFPSWPNDLDVVFHVVDTPNKYFNLMVHYEKWVPKAGRKFEICDLASLEFHLIIKQQNRQRRYKTSDQLTVCNE